MATHGQQVILFLISFWVFINVFIYQFFILLIAYIEELGIYMASTKNDFEEKYLGEEKKRLRSWQRCHVLLDNPVAPAGSSCSILQPDNNKKKLVIADPKSSWSLVYVIRSDLPKDCLSSFKI